MYDAAKRYDPARSLIYVPVQDARLDITQTEREEILRKARYFEANNAFANRLADLFEEYVVGSKGLRFIPSSEDQNWNNKIIKYINDNDKKFDITGILSFSGMQSLIARSWFIDGEIFILKTINREKRPVLQLIEAHKVKTPPDNNSIYKANIYDGIQLDSDGRPVYYYVEDGGKFRAIPANDIIHIFEPSRPTQLRGLSFFYPVLNDLHDLDDLQILEMKAAKINADITNIIETSTGEIDAGTLRRQKLIGGNINSVIPTEPQQFYRDAFGGRTVVLRSGDKFNAFMSQRPTVTTQEYWEHLIAKVCMGVGISKQLVFPKTVQGTITRADLDTQNNYFRSRSEVIAQGLKEALLYILDFETRNNPDFKNPPKDWRNFIVRPPKSVNVDIGRNSQALINELNSCIRTFQDIFAENGEDWREQIKQVAIERSYLRQLEQEYNLMEGELAINVQKRIIKQETLAQQEGT